jgi:hypothetical protein
MKTLNNTKTSPDLEPGLPNRSPRSSENKIDRSQLNGLHFHDVIVFLLDKIDELNERIGALKGEENERD